MSEQLILGVQLRDDASFANFSAGTNQQLVEILQTITCGDAEQFTYFWGLRGLGKSHLLQACCHEAQAHDRTALYLPLSRLDEFSIEMLQGLDSLDVLCVDDIQYIAGRADWEEAFFHLYNSLRDAQTRLVIAASAAPKEVGIQMPDVVSRLDWGLVFHLEALTEDAKVDNLHLRAKLRGFQMSDEVAHFLINHCQRDMPSLMGMLDQLDQASLVEKHRLTIPFVKSVLNI